MFQRDFSAPRAMEKLIIIANTGRVRPVKFKAAGDDPLEKDHLVEVPGSTVDMRLEPIHEVVTDQAGRFPQSGTLDRRGGMSYGEEHRMIAEMERQALERVAETIAGMVAGEGYPAWRLIMPQPVLPALVGMLPPEVHRVMIEAMPGDLTKLPIAELERRLLNGQKGR